MSRNVLIASTPLQVLLSSEKCKKEEVMELSKTANRLRRYDMFRVFKKAFYNKNAAEDSITVEAASAASQGNGGAYETSASVAAAAAAAKTRSSKRDAARRATAMSISRKPPSTPMKDERMIMCMMGCA